MKDKILKNKILIWSACVGMLFLIMVGFVKSNQNFFASDVSNYNLAQTTQTNPLVGDPDFVGPMPQQGQDFVGPMPQSTQTNTTTGQTVNNSSATNRGGNNDYIPLSGDGIFPEDNTSFNFFVQVLFNWGIVITIVLAILFIVIGGIQYMTTDAVFGKQEGKTKVQSAIAGLLLALTSWLLLQTINSQILDGSFSNRLNRNTENRNILTGNSNANNNNVAITNDTTAPIRGSGSSGNFVDPNVNLNQQTINQNAAQSSASAPYDPNLVVPPSGLDPAVYNDPIINSFVNISYGGVGTSVLVLNQNRNISSNWLATIPQQENTGVGPYILPPIFLPRAFNN
ncbi:MAG TPA: hypothetical protein PKA60_01060 [Candidatus Paceibacterota bacterium]|nr:hypothetical protein [Candidatus Paceibacterota bacterium]